MDLPVKTPTDPIPTDQKNQYRIRTKNLSFKLSPKHPFATPADATHILKDVNFEAKPCQITAIAGPSGAGKTTLLQILAGIIPPRKLSSGYVLLNDKPLNAMHFRRASGYVTQDDALFPLLTVEETLMYSARLRLHGGHNMTALRVRELLKELGLDHVAASRIGNESSRGISGGEKRRVSIGVELVHDPNILLVDEATSGLDSCAALHVMLLLKSMAKNQGKTILLTIHQPGFRILELFDNVVLLSNGIVLHHGSLYLLEEKLKLSGHFIPRQVNVLEFAIDVRESLVNDIEENHQIDVCVIKQEYEHIKSITSLDDGVEDQREIVYANPPLSEVMILSQRFSHNIFRTKQLFVAKMVQAILVGVLLGTIFMNSQKSKLETRVGFFAFSLTFLLYSTSEALPIFLQERQILMRETSSGAYRIASYTISNTLVFLPFLLVVAFLYATPIYWLVGLRREIDGFLYFTLVVWMVFLMSNSFVACFSALVPDFIMGMSLVAGLMGSFFLFSGYFISKDDIPKYWIFMHYLSLFKYPFECFVINEFEGRCLESIGNGECLVSGEALLMKLHLKESSQKWKNLVVMLAFIFGYRFLSFLILFYRSYRSRN